MVWPRRRTVIFLTDPSQSQSTSKSESQPSVTLVCFGCSSIALSSSPARRNRRFRYTPDWSTTTRPSRSRRSTWNTRVRAARRSWPPCWANPRVSSPSAVRETPGTACCRRPTICCRTCHCARWRCNRRSTLVSGCGRRPRRARRCAWSKRDRTALRGIGCYNRISRGE